MALLIEIIAVSIIVKWLLHLLRVWRWFIWRGSAAASKMKTSLAALVFRVCCRCLDNSTIVCGATWCCVFLIGQQHSLCLEVVYWLLWVSAICLLSHEMIAGCEHCWLSSVVIFRFKVRIRLSWHQDCSFLMLRQFPLVICGTIGDAVIWCTLPSFGCWTLNHFGSFKGARMLLLLLLLLLQQILWWDICCSSCWY